jgi:pyruvate/2-oxoglutarate dehydrogenase complex dihydrolipoamide dehydrogenase (E3) component
VNVSSGFGHTQRKSREGRFVLEPDPKVVRELLTRYASLRIAQAERERPAAARELADVSYTLCVMTATTSIHDAVAKADALLLAKGRTPDAARAADPDGESGLSLAV